MRARLKERDGISVDSVEEALHRIEADGCTRVIIQPTLLIPGEEYDRLLASVNEAAGKLKVAVGRPLLCDGEDLVRMVELMRTLHPVGEDTVLLAMVHGTYHARNDLYEQLAGNMRQAGPPFMRLCTVESLPSFEEALAELAALPFHKAHLIPLMLVAGEHAHNDMAGEEEDSLRSLLEQRGFSVSWSEQGLGNPPQIRNLYAQRALETVQVLP